MNKNMKKFTWLVFVVFFLAFVPMLTSQVSVFAGGDGSSGNPYQIVNCFQLQEMNNFLNASYILMNDIDCSETVSWNDGAGFVPFSDFGGTFDGQSHTITGLIINRPSNNAVGLFGSTRSGAIIKNVGLVNIKITGSSDEGGLVGWNNGPIINSYSTGDVSGTGPDNVGGLIGCNYGGTITNSYATGDVSGSWEVGGLVGNIYIIGTITNSYATGKVTGSSYIVGGLVGCRDIVKSCVWAGSKHIPLISV
jgi:hypothetical protein